MLEFVVLRSYYVSHVQEIIHSVEVNFIAVATPLAARVLLPVVHAHASLIVSVVIEIVITHAAF